MIHPDAHHKKLHETRLYLKIIECKYAKSIASGTNGSPVGKGIKSAFDVSIPFADIFSDIAWRAAWESITI